MVDKPTEDLQWVAHDLRIRITEGDLRHDDVLPSVGKLLDKYQCARPVVNRALTLLEAEGLIQTSQGRRAAILRSAPQIELVGDRLRGFSELWRERGNDPSTQLVGLRIKSKAERLHTRYFTPTERFGDERVIEVERIRRVNLKVVAWQLTYLPFRFYEQLTQATLNEFESLFKIYSKYFNFTPKMAQEFLSVPLATEEVAAQLGLRAGENLVVRRERVSWVVSPEQPVEILVSWDVPTYFRYCYSIREEGELPPYLDESDDGRISE